MHFNFNSFYHLFHHSLPNIRPTIKLDRFPVTQPLLHSTPINKPLNCAIRGITYPHHPIPIHKTPTASLNPSLLYADGERGDLGCWGKADCGGRRFLRLSKSAV